MNELQRRLAAMIPSTGGTTPGTTMPTPAATCTGIPAPKDGTYLGRDASKNVYSYPEVIGAMNDLIAMAFACDLTRVVTFMSEIPLNTQTNFSFVGVNSSNYHDDISHHGGDPVKLDGIQKVNTFYATQFAALLAKLAAATDVDGSSVLDNCAIIFTSEFGDGDDHYHYDLPVVLAGRAGGAFATGRHIHYPSTPDKGAGAISTARRADKPLANLYISIMQAFGLAVTTFGSVDGQTPYGTGPLSELAG